MHRGSEAERTQDYDLAVVEYTQALRANPEDNDARVSLERAKLRASQDHFNKGAAAGSGRQVRPGARRIRARGRAESQRRRRRRGTALDAQQAASQGRRSARRQDRTRDHHRPNPRSAAARDGPAAGRENARVADLSRRQQPRRFHRHGTAGQHQRDLRFIVSRSAGHGRSAECVAGRCTDDGFRSDALVLPRDRAENHHHHSRHAGEAPRVRGGSRPHVLPEQRRPQGNHGPAADGARRADAFRQPPPSMPSPSRTRPSGSPRRAASLPPSTRRVRK